MAAQQHQEATGSAFTAEAKAPTQEPEAAFPRWLTVTTGVVLHALVLVHLARAIHLGMDLWLWIVMPFAGWCFIDILTLLTHWILDNYFDPKTPIIGKTVYYFREHHRTPESMFVRDYFDGNFENALVAMLVLLTCLFMGVSGAGSLFLAVAGLAGSYITTVHKWTHDPKPPRFARAMQKIGLLVGSNHHDRHHADTRGHYALFSGHIEPILEGMRFFETSEVLIYWLTGAVAVESRLKLGTPGEVTTIGQRYRRIFWRVWYAFLAWYSRKKKAEFTCMNWGYAEHEAPEGQATADAERYQLQLYGAAVKGLPVEDGFLADISCGRGGGLAWLHRQMMPYRSVGVDYTQGNVDLCKASFGQVGGLAFQQGDAENMPFDDASVRVLISVEASHCYPRPALFLAEAERVLEPGGYLAWTDFCPADDLKKLKAMIPPGLELVTQRDITANVLLAMAKDSPRRMQMIEQYTTPMLRPLMRHFAAANESAETVQRFRNGSSVYFLWQLRKRGNATAQV